MIRILFVGLLLCCLAACSTPPIPIDYKGTDGGTVVVSIGTTDTYYSTWTLMFRRRGDAGVPKTATGSFTYRKRELLMGMPSDYDNREDKGVVLVTHLPEGDYEIYQTSEFFNGGMAGTATYWSTEPFAIPFSVHRGEVVYLGNYMASPTYGRNLLGFRIHSNAYYTIEDRKDIDLPIAAKKGMSATPAAVKDLTPDAGAMHVLNFATPAEHLRRKAASK
jgi:hypothetical protein